MHLLSVFLFALALNAENTEKTSLLNLILEKAHRASVSIGLNLAKASEPAKVQVLRICSQEDLVKATIYTDCSYALFGSEPKSGHKEFIIETCGSIPTLSEGCEKALDSIFISEETNEGHDGT